MKAWKKHPNNFIEMPKLTKYKNGEFLLVLTNQQCSIENGLLKFPNFFRKSILFTIYIIIF